MFRTHQPFLASPIKPFKLILEKNDRLYVDVCNDFHIDLKLKSCYDFVVLRVTVEYTYATHSTV